MKQYVTDIRGTPLKEGDRIEVEYMGSRKTGVYEGFSDGKINLNDGRRSLSYPTDSRIRILSAGKTPQEDLRNLDRHLRKMFLK